MTILGNRRYWVRLNPQHCMPHKFHFGIPDNGIYHVRNSQGKWCTMEKSVYTREYQVVLELLAVARKTSGITQVELADRLGTTQSYVSKIERGELRLDILQLRAVCRALGTPLADFVSRLDSCLAESEKKRGKKTKRAKK